MAESPAAWHPDPFGRYELRYWDGDRWTEHVCTAGQQYTDPPVTISVTAASGSQRAAAGWYPDPISNSGRRYWDGSTWLDQGEPSESDVCPASAPKAGSPGSDPDVTASQDSEDPGATVEQPSKSRLLTEQVLVVNQKVRPFGSTLGYAICDSDGHQIGAVQEIRRDVATAITDRVVGGGGSRRSRRFRVVDTTGRVLLEMSRPRPGWLQTKAKLVIDGPDGTPIGEIIHESLGLAGKAASAAHLGVTHASDIAIGGIGGLRGLAAGLALGGVQERLTSAVDGLDKVGHARFGLESGGRRVGSVHGQNSKEWDFQVRDPNGSEVARITKTWAGWAKERFTKADNYVVAMSRPLDNPLRSLVIAAALAIDVELKQGDPSRGSSLLGTRRYA